MIKFKDAQAAKQYIDLATKMAEDSRFIEKSKSVKSYHDLYTVYKDSGYTKLDFSDFSQNCMDFTKMLEGESSVEVRELSEEDLEKIAGGGLFDFLTAVVEFIPIIGPLLSGVAEAAISTSEGQPMAGLIHFVWGAAGAALDLTGIGEILTIINAGCTVITGEGIVKQITEIVLPKPESSW